MIIFNQPVGKIHQSSSFQLIVIFVLSFVVILNAANAGTLPREPKPAPKLPKSQPLTPKPKPPIGTRPVFDPSNISALPDLIIQRGVRTKINSHVIAMCKAGKKNTANSSIPVLNFEFVVKNIGKGTAYMNRDGVIVSTETTDFHERVFDSSKYYLGGAGGPGYFINAQGRRQKWILKKMSHLKPGQTIIATGHLGVGYNNRTFTLNRLQELAGTTHQFRIKLTSYGKPGLKESRTDNNEMLVSYTFPKNFCKPQLRPVSQRVENVLPDLTIVGLKPRLSTQAIDACKTGRSEYGRLVRFDVIIKNIGAGSADLTKYNFAIHSNSIDDLEPEMKGGNGYGDASRTPRSVGKGQLFRVYAGTGVLGTHFAHGRALPFPVSRYAELAGKTRRFKVDLISGKDTGEGLPESNYKNNSKSVSFTFPKNFCKSS